MLKSISAKFSASLIAVISLGIAVGAIGLFNSNKIVEANAKNDFTHQVIESVLSVRENLLNIETGERGFLLRGDENYLQPYSDGKKEVDRQLSRALDLTRQNPLVTAKLTEFRKNYDQWLNTVVDPLIKARRAVNAGQMSPDEFDLLVKNTPGKPLMDKMRAELGDVEKEEFRLLEERKAASKATFENSIVLSIAITLLATAVGLGLNFIIAQMFKRKVGVATRHIEALAEGRLNSQIEVMGKDEIDHLLSALSKAQTNLRGLIDGIRSSTLSISDSSNVVRTASDEMSKAAVEQADATASMAAAVEQLTVSIGQITENSNEASETAMDAKVSAEQGMQTLGQVVTGIRKIADSVQGSAQTVRSLEQQSNEISEIISTITDIANRTNLLALNAAIEAARAGESGRGFAVVADEVRKLAEQTKGSSERISNMVFEIQRITRDASDSMETSVGLVEEGIAQADSVSETIDKIKTNADRVSHAIQAISVSMQEQSNVSVEISRNVERVAQMTEENTASIEQNKQIAQEISSLSGSLATSVSVFKT